MTSKTEGQSSPRVAQAIAALYKATGNSTTYFEVDTRSDYRTYFKWLTDLGRSRGESLPPWIGKWQRPTCSILSLDEYSKVSRLAQRVKPWMLLYSHPSGQPSHPSLAKWTMIISNFNLLHCWLFPTSNVFNIFLISVAW